MCWHHTMRRADVVAGRGGMGVREGGEACGVSGGVLRETLMCLCTAETRVAVAPHKSK